MPDNTIFKRTLRATTQLSISEIDYDTPLKHHMKHYFLQFKHKQFSDDVNTDTLLCKKDTPSIREYRYVQVFIAKRTRFIKVYLMKNRIESIDALSMLLLMLGSQTCWCMIKQEKRIAQFGMKNSLHAKSQLINQRHTINIRTLQKKQYKS